MEEICSFIDFFHQMVEHFWRQGLGTVAEGLLRVIVDLDHETIGSGCDSCHGKRLHHEADACRMARVDDDRKMGLFLLHRDRGDIQRISVGSLKGADAAFAEDDFFISACHDVLRTHQKLV